MSTKTITKTKALIADAQDFLQRIGGGGDAGTGGDDPGVEVDKRTKALMRSERITSYSEALQIVLREDRDLARRYADESTAKQYASEAGADSSDPIDLLVHREVLAWIGRHPGMSYTDALAQVLDARPDLKTLYADWRGR